MLEDENFKDLFDQNSPCEKPLECSECKKEGTVTYTEMNSNSLSRSCMCEDCPILQQKLYGSNAPEFNEQSNARQSSLCCGNCGTTLEDVRTGNPLGCETCYEIFSDVLVMEMLASNKISQRLNPEESKKSAPLHIGRAPGQSAKINPSLRLIALNEALNETLAREDYEQAAWLRDQIKELTEETAKEPKND